MHLNRKIPKLAIPLMLSHVTVPLLGFVNTVIAGHFSKAYFLSVIGLGSMMFNFLYWGLGFFRMSVTGLIAQSHLNSPEKTIDILRNSLLLALMAGLGLIFLEKPIFYFFNFFIHPEINITALLKQYYFIRIFGAPAVLLNYVIIGALIAIQKTRGPLIILTITNLLAILVSVICVYVFGLKVSGLALGDVVGQYIGLAVGCYILSLYINFTKILENLTVDSKKIIALLHINKNIFIRTACLLIIFSFFTIWSGHISPLILAANTVLMNFFQIIVSTLGGFDNVAEALSGNAVGFKDKNKFLVCLYDVGVWSFICSVILTLCYLLFGRNILALMTDITTVYYTAGSYIYYVVALPLVAFPSFLLDGVAIGAHLFKEMRNSMILTLIGFFLIWYCLRSLDNSGLWLAFCGFFILRAIFLGFYLKRFYKSNF